jgi:hypothetical protein
MEKVKILTDEPKTDGKSGFDQYASSLVSIIMGSQPQFTIGIFGGWGTGKTTLMQMMYEMLQDDEHNKNAVPVWFNAWLYEREEHLAIVPLLSTILEELKGRPELNSLKNKVSDAKDYVLKTFSFDLDVVQIDPGKAIEEDGTIYYNKFKQIEDEIQKASRKKDIRIIVFIDDLDRCAPDKVLEVLESIKIFLGIKGFIYVLGLSQEVIETCINKKYEGLHIKGSDYVKKIIQIPFSIPDWRDEELEEYVGYLTEELEDPYKKLFSEMKQLVVDGLENNPREIKRFINSYIATQEVFKKDNLDPYLLLLLKIFQFKWPAFYNAIFDYKGDSEFYDDIIKSIEDEKFESARFKDFINQHAEEKVFLKSEVAKDIFFSLSKRTNLDRYRRAGKVISEKAPEVRLDKETLLKKLLDDVGEFYRFRHENPTIIIDLSGVDLSGANLERAYLNNAILTGAYLNDTKFIEAKLARANLSGAQMEKTDLTRAKMNNAKLWDANLKEAKLCNSYLKDADFYKADLSSADLTDADLTYVGLGSAHLEGAKFKNAIFRQCNLKGAIFDEKTDFTEADLDSATIDTIKGSNWDVAQWPPHVREELEYKYRK